MKKLALSIVVLLVGFSAMAQDVFAKLGEMREVSEMVVNQKMFKMLGKMDLDSKDPEMKSYIDMVNSMDDIKIYATKDATAAQTMASTFKGYLASTKMEELMRVKKDGKNVKFYAKPGKNEDHVSEFLMFIDGAGGEDTVIAKITGNIDLKEIGKIASSINFEGSEELKNVKTNN